MLLVVQRGRERETYEIAFDLPVSESRAGGSTEGYAGDVLLVAPTAPIAQDAGQYMQVRVEVRVGARPNETISRRVQAIDTPNETINRRGRP